MSFQRVAAAVADSGRGHAVVLGGSLAGLLAARVLARHFEQVTIVERDAYPSDAAVRRGVPQANHVHALMRRGQQVLEALFPGLLTELLNDGAHLVDVAGEIAWLTPEGWGTRFPSDLNIVGFTRPLLDLHVRLRLGSDARVRILEETEILRLLPGARGGGGVCGALTRTRRPGSTNEELRAELVVDATGRGSRAPRLPRNHAHAQDAPLPLPPACRAARAASDVRQHTRFGTRRHPANHHNRPNPLGETDERNEVRTGRGPHV